MDRREEWMERFAELNKQVREYWERSVCGTGDSVVGTSEPMSPEWYRTVETRRYDAEPVIHSVAKFTLHGGKRLLEIGVGAGADHVQWARAGADCYGVDLTDAAIDTTRAHLALHDLSSNLQRCDAESLPFDDGFFDLVYSWGVIHHSEHPNEIVSEIHRVLRPEGRFIGMLYNRRSWAAFRAWMRHALFKGRPWRSFSAVIWNHVESTGTKAYTVSEVRSLFEAFATVSVEPATRAPELRRLPQNLRRWIPPALGWFLTIDARK